MGFRWRRQNNRLLLLERHDIVAARAVFLREMRKNAAVEHPLEVIYLDETFLHKTETVSKLWHPEPNEKAACCIKVPVGKGPRLIIVHAGGKNGWVDGAHLMWKSNNPESAGYHGDMNAQKFEEWFVNLCMILEGPTMVVMDNASYHSITTEKVPTTSWTKAAIQDWMRGKGIPVEKDALKAELLSTVRSQPRKKQYKLDEIAESHGHRVLRLPPYHCDLNPIELVWGQCKRYVRQNNSEFTLSALEVLWKEAVESVTAERWADCVCHAEKVGQEYWKNDGLVENEIERLVISFGSLDKSDSESESAESESEEDLGVALLPRSP